MVPMIRVAALFLMTTSAAAQQCGLVSQCPAATSVGATDLLYLVQAGVSKNVTAQLLLGSLSLIIGTTPITGGSSGQCLTVTGGVLSSQACGGGGSGVTSIAGNVGAFTLAGLLTNAANVLQVVAAAKSDQQAASSATLAVTPAQQQSHPSAVKATVAFTGSSAAIQSSYNVTSVSRTSTGLYTVTFTIAFAGTTYNCQMNTETTIAIGAFCFVPTGGRATGTLGVDCLNSSTLAVTDPVTVFVECTGGQ